MEHENARLKAKLSRHFALVKAAEAERDDLRDAVLRLIEKGRFSFWRRFWSAFVYPVVLIVEASSDYSKWPRSQIQLSSLSGSLFVGHVLTP